MNGSDAHPASMVNKIIWSCYVTLDSLISSPVLAGWASDPFMLPPCRLQAVETSRHLAPRPCMCLTEFGKTIGRGQGQKAGQIFQRATVETFTCFTPE